MTDITTILAEFKKAQEAEKGWVQIRKALAAQIAEHFEIPEGQQSKTFEHDDLKIEVKQSTSVTVDQDELKEQDLNSFYPEVFPMKYSFSKTGFNKLPDTDKKTLQLSGAIVTKTGAVSVSVKENT